MEMRNSECGMRNIWSAAAKLPLFVFKESSLDEQDRPPSESHERDRRRESFSTLSRSAPQRHFLRLYLYYFLLHQCLSLANFQIFIVRQQAGVAVNDRRAFETHGVG